MNFEILQKAIPDETMRAFLDKKVRYDNRQFEQRREFTYTSNALDSFEISAIGSLGLNKVIIVLKEDKESKEKMSLVIESMETSKQNSMIKVYNYVNKLISNNISSESKKGMKMYITIESDDGNVYDTIANTLMSFFNESDWKIKNKYQTTTICVLNDEVLIDPSKEEAKLAEFMFNVIKFDSGEMYIHKIKGEFIKWEKIKEIVNTKLQI